jgi:hypothetical protein
MAQHCAVNLPSLVAAIALLACSGSSPGGAATGGASNGGVNGTSGTTNASGTTGGGSSNGNGGQPNGNAGGTAGMPNSSGGAMNNAGSNSGGSSGEVADAGSSGGGNADGGAPVVTIVGTLGDPCAPNGAYGCAGEAQKGQLICSDGEWAPNGNCAGDTNCDSTEGPNAGSCQPIQAECADKDPGAIFCRNGDDIFQCGPQEATCEQAERVQCGSDLVTLITLEQCPYLCTDGECTGTVCENGYTCPCEAGDPAFTCDDRSNETYAQCLAMNRICPCECECGAGKVLCDGVCTSLGADDHCGDCDTVCPADQGASCHTGVDPNMGYCDCDTPGLIFCPNGQCRVSCPP